MAKISHRFIDFGFVLGTVSFDSDAEYDNCIGYVTLMVRDEMEIYECFQSPAERDKLLARAFKSAAEYFKR